TGPLRRRQGGRRNPPHRRRRPGDFDAGRSEMMRRRACRLEHGPEKWMPVFRKDHAPTKELDHDPIQFDRIMVYAADFAADFAAAARSAAALARLTRSRISSIE